MKKIISIIAVLCMLVGCMAVMASANGNFATATDAGYGVIDRKNNCINFYFANADVAANIKKLVDKRAELDAANAAGTRTDTTRPFTGLCMELNGALKWNGDTPLQIGGDLEVNVDKKTAKMTLTNWTVADAIDNTGTAYPAFGKSFKDWSEIDGYFTCGRFEYWWTELNEAADGAYFCYYLPVYDGKAPDFNKGANIVKAVLMENGKELHVVFDSEIDNVYDSGNGRDDYMAGQFRYCAIRIVDNMKDQNLMWDGETPAQWDAPFMDYCTSWPSHTIVCPITFGNLGCNSFEDICKLVDKGGKFEGCVVTWCLEECGTEAHPAAAADGKILCIFANGKYGFEGSLNATRVVDGQLDGAYVELYNPNAADTADHTLAIVAVIAACAAGVVLASKKH